MSADRVSYRPRLVDPALQEAMTAFAAVMAVGPRATGKTTTAARLAAQVDRLDVPDVAATYRADPDAALRRAGRPLLLDEWQEVPEANARTPSISSRSARSLAPTSSAVSSSTPARP